jgi:hypothetical protein
MRQLVAIQIALVAEKCFGSRDLPQMNFFAILRDSWLRIAAGHLIEGGPGQTKESRW